MESLRNVYQAHLFNTSTNSLNTYQILNELYSQTITPKMNKSLDNVGDSKYIMLEKKVDNVLVEPLKNEFEEDFELIEMNDLENFSPEEKNFVEKLLIVVFCDKCGCDVSDENNVENRMEVMPKCAHRFCAKCLTDASFQFINNYRDSLLSGNSTKNTILKCLVNNFCN